VVRGLAKPLPFFQERPKIAGHDLKTFRVAGELLPPTVGRCVW
jgi:hypothetical protein